MDFDPDAAATADSGLFGLPHGPDDARVHVLGVPFEATTSYRGGTSRAPEAILAASRQIDLFDLRFGRPYEQGIWMAPIDERIAAWSHEARVAAEPIIEKGGATGEDAAAVAAVDAASQRMNEVVEAFFLTAFDAGKLPILIGGDHSTPFGAMKAAAARFPGLGILQFDAHADLRVAYEGFAWSHASVLHNVLEHSEGVARLVQVGIRDLAAQEHQVIQANPLISAVFDHDLANARFDGRVRELARETIASLPDTLYVTFDIDALDPTLCPGTGTPVPGGLLWDETMVWLEELRASGKRIVGADINEVSAGEAGDQKGESWDAIVGARLLYRLIGAATPA